MKSKSFNRGNKYSDFNDLIVDLQRNDIDLPRELKYAIALLHNYVYTEFVLLNFIFYQLGIMVV